MRELLIRFRPLFLYAGLFSLCSNLLMLVPSLYMLQVYDRVMISGSALRCGDLMCRKWMSRPSISVVNCGSAFNSSWQRNQS